MKCESRHYPLWPLLTEVSRLPIIIRIQEDCTPEVAAALDVLRNEMKNRNLTRNGKRPLRGGEASHDEIETAIIQALAPLQDTLNFKEIISKTNDYKQTLAHFAVFFGYTSLLRRLMGWNIDLTIADVNGFTALHCAYKTGDKDCVDLLLENGASETVLDALGRAPSHLMPEGFAEMSDHDYDTVSDGQPGLEQKRDTPLLFQSTDSGDGRLDSGDEKSMEKVRLADLIQQSQSSGAASNSQSAPSSSPLPVAPTHPPLSPTPLTARFITPGPPPPDLSPLPPPSSSRPHAESVSSLQRSREPPITSVAGTTSMYIPPGAILAVPADNPSGPPIHVIPYDPQSSPFAHKHQNKDTAMNWYGSPPPPPPPPHPPLPSTFQRVLVPPRRCHSLPPGALLSPSTPLASPRPLKLPELTTRWSTILQRASSSADSSSGVQQPSVGYSEQGVVNNLATQQTSESFACGGLKDGVEEICVPETQNSKHAVTPQQFDVKVNCEPINHGEAAAVPVPQASLPLGTKPDSGTTT